MNDRIPADQYQLTDQLTVSACERCPNLCESRSQIVNGVGPTDANVVLVGEAPGATEDETGEPFTGRSGDILDEALENAGFNRDNLRITNCARCRPPDNRDPHVSELDNCSAYLFEELQRIDPDVVIPLGRVPTRQVLGDRMTDSVTALAGERFEGAVYDIIVSVHPAATIYNRDLRPTFTKTFETAASRVDG